MRILGLSVNIPGTNILACFEIYLNVASEKQDTIIQTSSGNIGHFLLKYAFWL